MRSRYADKFNHDADAADYDQDVLEESHPIRAGYTAVLDWVAAQAGGAGTVVELGTGTGNLALRLSGCERMVCVDVSREMLCIAREKLDGVVNAHFIECDLLEYFDAPRAPCDALVSTYAVHHLTETEKMRLFRAVESPLAAGGVAAFGDLMFESAGHRRRCLEAMRDAGQGELADDIEDEFFWNLDTAVPALEQLGLRVDVERFSELSWGVAAHKPLK